MIGKPVFTDSMRELLTCLLLGCSISASAQIKGKVTDEAGVPLPGANLIWLGTTQGTTTGDDGKFSIRKPGNSSQLVVSYVGFENDTLLVESKNKHLDITLREQMMEGVEISVRRVGLTKMKGVLNEDMISTTELFRAACCNLGESFTTNPSVDVSYNDAATGAKQVKLLGLSGTYVQMLTENIPNYRGAASPYALGYIPGPWMQSIQVSKGASSVKNGYESITGQINVEFKKPQSANSLNVNLYGSSKSKFEANLDANINLKNKWSTGVLAHYEDNYKDHDENGDGFLDTPKIKQVNLQHRWAYMGDSYIFQASVKGMKEDRTSGQTMHLHVPGATASGKPLYQIGIETDRYEAFAKNAFVLNKEHNTNVALILSGSLHQQDATFGQKLYQVDQKNFYASLMYESDLTKQHALSAGISLNHDYYKQHFTEQVSSPWQISRDRETVPGAYAQYTYNWEDKLILMAGIRADHSNIYGNFVTPRAHIKWAPNDIISLRASAGKGYRSVHALAENNYLLASSRRLIIDDLKQEEAWNYGASAALTIPIAERNLNINAEYYYTHFINQAVIDMDTDAHAVHFTNLEGKSYSHTFQIEASYPIFQDFTLTAAYRLTDVKTTYNRVLMERPLTNKYKGLVTASYQTPLGLWQFDVTLQLNGGGRMPAPYTAENGQPSWDARYKGFEQLSAQVTRWFRYFSVYVGGENLTGFKQKNPIIGASDPWGSSFDSTMVWGPVHGAMFYAGIRFNLEKD